MAESRYEDGDIVFREGDACDRVCLVVSGMAEVVRGGEGEEGGEGEDRENGGEVVLGRVGPGEYVGEMGVLIGEPRSATVRAAGDLVVEDLPAEAFLRRVSEDSDTALHLLRRLCARLHSTDDALTAALRGETAQPAKAGARAAADGPDQLPLRLFADGDRAAGVIPAGGLPVTRFPFVVGRTADGDEEAPPLPLDLEFPGQKHTRLSRIHFAIMAGADGPVIVDMGSRLGTEVGGVFLGDQFARDRTALAPGDNRIVAGGVGSPFVFRVTLDGG